MEAALTLSYCGGVYHFLAWNTSRSPSRRWLHVAGVAIYFVLGFMTKFVAAMFLPLILGAAVVLSSRQRTMVVREWRSWAAGAALAALLIAPWFVYAFITHGSLFWDTIFVAHVLLRFTTSEYPGTRAPVELLFHGAVSVVYRVRRPSAGIDRVRPAAGANRSPTMVRRDGARAVVRSADPADVDRDIEAVSLHLSVSSAPGDRRRISGGARRDARTGPPGSRVRRCQCLPNGPCPLGDDRLQTPSGPRGLFLLAGTAVVLATINLISGPTRIAFGRSVLFRSSGILRPLLVVALFGVLGGRRDRPAGSWPCCFSRARCLCRRTATRCRDSRPPSVPCGRRAIAWCVLHRKARAERPANVDVPAA